MQKIYDNSTKDKELSYYVDILLDKLGFRKNTLGTKYLRDLILFIYFNNVYDIFIDKACINFLKSKNIMHISKKNFINRLDYAIKNVDIDKFQKNFYSIFHIEYDIYYLSVKNIVILLVNKIKIWKTTNLCKFNDLPFYIKEGLMVN